MYGKMRSKLNWAFACNRRGAVVNGSVEYRILGEDMPRKPVV